MRGTTAPAAGSTHDHHRLAVRHNRCWAKRWPPSRAIEVRATDMAKVNPSNWTEQHNEGDFDSASNYLSLLLPATTAGDPSGTQNLRTDIW